MATSRYLNLLGPSRISSLLACRCQLEPPGATAGHEDQIDERWVAGFDLWVDCTVSLLVYIRYNQFPSINDADVADYQSKHHGQTLT